MFFGDFLCDDVLGDLYPFDLLGFTINRLRHMPQAIYRKLLLLKLLGDYYIEMRVPEVAFEELAS